MLERKDSIIQNSTKENILFENVNKILSTFVPTNHQREISKVKKNK